MFNASLDVVYPKTLQVGNILNAYIRIYRVIMESSFVTHIRTRERSEDRENINTNAKGATGLENAMCQVLSTKVNKWPTHET